MRKYGKWLLVMAVLAAVPGVASADGYLAGLSQQRAQAASAAQKQRNQQHAEQVKAALQNARIDGYGIRIEVVDGVVTLSGNVRNPDHRTKAAAACQQIPEITRVVNNLEYAPQGGAAPQTAAKPLATAKPQTSRRDTARPAAATLLDFVRGNRSQNTPAPATAARPAPAVQQVRAESTGPSNQQIAEQIGGSLRQAGLSGTGIQVNFQNGIVTLSGDVNNAAQRTAAEAAASRVSGVRMVNNQLEIPAPTQTAAIPQQFAPQQFAPQMTPASYGQQPPFAPAGFPQGETPISQPAPQMQPVSAGPAAIGAAGIYSHPHMPGHAWPSYAQYPNSAAVTYPTQYSASAFPYIGPFYPYPQVPLGWREARLQWDDGFWSLNFNKQQDVWHVLFHPWEKD